jgi:hypothetical protein
LHGVCALVIQLNVVQQHAIDACHSLRQVSSMTFRP